MKLRLRKFNLYQVIDDKDNIVGTIAERKGYWLWRVGEQSGKASSQDLAAKKVISHGS